MNMKRTNRRCVKIFSLCFLAAAAISFTACTNAKRDDPAGMNGTMNVDFEENRMVRNGTEYYTYRVEEGQKGIVSIHISRESGRLDIDVYPVDRKDDPDYTGRDLDSAAFDVIVEQPGEYKVCFTATEFSGDYGIHWRTEDDTEK